MADVALQGSADIWTERDSAEPGWSAVERRAAGNTLVGEHLVADHEDLSGAASAALGVLAEVLEHDVDALYASAFEYCEADEEAARAVLVQVRSEGGGS
ncbi:MAG: hypothetical protein ACRCSN_18385 [Dermatophilaceae bacterium]